MTLMNAMRSVLSAACLVALLAGADPVLGQVETNRDIGPPAPQLDPVESLGPRLVRGELLKIEGDTYIIRDTDSQEVKLEVGAATKVERDSFKIGDKVEARVTPDGHAEYIRPAQKIP